MYKIKTYSTEYNELINSLNTVKNILDDVKTELKKQRVSTPINYEDLKLGNFVEIFKQYHLLECAKDPAEPTFEMYLQYRGLNTNNLQKLQQEYKIWLQYRTSFYTTNHKFYSYFERNGKNNIDYKKIIANAPKKRDYTLFDFVIIKKDSISIIVPKEPFNLYVSKHQKEIIKNINEFISIAKKLNMEHQHIEPALRKYLAKRGRLDSKIGLTKDLNEINLDYNYILTL